MTEWTSISVTEEQKETLEAEKPDGMAMGAFLVQQIESNMDGGIGDLQPFGGKVPDGVIQGDVEFEPIIDTEALFEAIEDVKGGPVSLEATEYKEIADEVEGRLR